jgi:hypothetical protein
MVNQSVVERSQQATPILAVGIDPAKRVHRAVGVLFPDEVVFDRELPNALDAI